MMTTKTNEYFSKVASNWDLLRKGFFSEAIRDLAIQKAYLRPDMIVADIGGGTGFLSKGMANLVQEVHLVDASPEMLSQAQKNLSDWVNIHYHLADGLRIPLPDQSMDAVLANMYLHHCADPLGSILEMVRLLKPNGRLIFTDLDSHTYTWLKEEMADTWLGFNRDQIREWFQKAGLVNIFVTCTDQSCCAASADQSVQEDAKISTFIAVGTKRMSRKQTVQESYSIVAEKGCKCSQIYNEEENNCCPPQAKNLYYQPDQLLMVPQEAGELSLGCGNPTAMAALKPGETVIDIGSGGGLDSFIAANKIGSTGKVIGVDMTDAMLERATKSAKKNGYTNVEFRKGEAENIPVADSFADVILSNCVINLTEDKGKTFKEAYRVLKTGGRLEISDTVTTKSMPGQFLADQHQWAACVSGSLPLPEYQDLITEAGFTIIETRQSAVSPIDEFTGIFNITLSAIK
jgi:ubiquinone/menaquinone biosynthesis C-methylase UbiE